MIVTTGTLLTPPGRYRVDMGYGSEEKPPAKVIPRFGEPLAEYRERILATAQGTLKRILELSEVVLVCACRDASLCHRTTLAGVLSSLGATFVGERVLPLVAARCSVRFCGASLTETQALCPQHWHMLPPDLQRLLVATYLPTQRHDGLFTKAWFAAMGQAMRCIAEATEEPEPPTDEWSHAWGHIVPLTREGRDALWPKTNEDAPIPTEPRRATQTEPSPPPRRRGRARTR